MPKVTSFTLPLLPASAKPVPVVGGMDVLTKSIDIADRAETSLHVDTFRPTRTQNLEAFGAAKARGVDVNLLLDTDTIAADRGAVEALGRVHELGTDPFKQHGKAISRDGVEAFVATDVSDVKSEQRMEFGVHFQGPAAAALQAVQQLTPQTPRKTAVGVLDAARAVGVLANDPHQQTRHVSSAVRGLINAAKDELYVVSKLFDSPDASRQIAAAAERGTTTTVVTHDIIEKQADRMRKAGVDVQVVPYANAAARKASLHGTVVAADGRAVLTSMPMADKALDGSNGRQSRELGVAVGGETASDLVARIRTTLDAVPRA